MPARAQIVTMRNSKLPVSVASQLPLDLFDRLEAHCKAHGILKAEFIRRLIAQALPPEPKTD